MPGHVLPRAATASSHIGSPLGAGTYGDWPILVDTCRREMAARGLTTTSPRSAVGEVVDSVLAGGGAPRSRDLVAELVTALTGWGAIQELLDMPLVEEVWWNDPARVFYSQGGETRLSNIVLSDAEAQSMVLRAVSTCGRRIDTTQPYVDAQLVDGSRLHVVIPPITSRHWAVNIRRYVVRPTGLGDLVATRTLPAEAAAVLGAAMKTGANVVVSGGTQTGKTTMLNALLSSVPGQRVITCEEVRELRLPVADWVALQTRDPGLEGTGAVALRDLVREALRMRPQRVVVGEVRGAEALDLLLAMNCGVPAAGTLHANSAADAVDRLTGLPLLAGPNIAEQFVSRTVASCIDLVIHLVVTAQGQRRVDQIATVAPGAHGPVVGHLFRDTGAGLQRAGGEIPQAWQETA